MHRDTHAGDEMGARSADAGRDDVGTAQPVFRSLFDTGDVTDPEVAEAIRNQPFHREDQTFLDTIRHLNSGERTLNQCMHQAVCELFMTHAIPIDPDEAMSAQIEAVLLRDTNELIRQRNDAAVEDELRERCAAMQPPIDPANASAAMRKAAAAATVKIMPQMVLSPQQVAEVLTRLHCVARIPAPTDPQGLDSPMLGVYQFHGMRKGLYVTNEDAIAGLVTRYVYNHDQRYTATVIDDLMHLAPLRMQPQDQDLVAVNNGVFNVATQQLMDFDPSMVFLSKTFVDYDGAAENPVIDNGDGTTWDVDSWIDSLSDSPGVPELLWQVASAVVRPQVPWDKGVWLVNPAGANGKGTYLQLLKNLCGPQGVAWTTIPLEDFGRQFGLETLIGKSAILNDETRSDGYIDNISVLKAIITHDTVNVTRKNKVSVTYQAKVLLVQCTNDPPRVRDKTGSWLRRLLLIPFDKNFRRMGDNPRIKADYVNRPEVLRYVLKKALSIRCYRFIEPEATKRLLRNYERDNDALLDFWEQYKDRFSWKLLPWDFLFDVYKGYCEQNGIQRSYMLGKRKFTSRINAIVDEGATDPSCRWASLHGKSRRPGNYMQQPEQIIIDMRECRSMDRWRPHYSGNDLQRLATIDQRALPTRMDGLILKSVLEDERPDEDGGAR